MMNIPTLEEKGIALILWLAMNIEKTMLLLI